MEKNYRNKADIDEEEVESPFLRRVVQILTQKSQIDMNSLSTKKQVHCTSILQRSLSEVRVRDLLLSIANLCPNFCIFDIISNLDEAYFIMKTATPVIVELLNNCFVETKSTKRITTIKWPTDVKSMIFRQSDTTITQEDCLLQIERN